MDRALGKHQVADVLRRAGAHVEVHDDHFPPSTTDVEWLGEVGRRRWVVLTKDARIRQRRLELRALERAGVKAFALTHGNLAGNEMAEIFVRHLPRILRISRTSRGPLLRLVTRSGIRRHRLGR